MVDFKLGYRPELDGVRGISILMVLVHHLSPSHLWGGFLGVDIFFVLSGFLITSLLVQEWNKSGSINLKFFYLRRGLRLMPALLTVLVLVCLYVFLFQDSVSTKNALQGAGLTLAYISNWVQALSRISMGPFDITWSLAIEEQFYLLWPVTLIGLLSLLKRRLWIVAVIALGILLVAVFRPLHWQGGAGYARSYYGSDTRADALLSGCLAGLLLSSGLITRHSTAKNALKVLAALSLIFLIYWVLTLNADDQMLYWGGFTVIALMVSICLVVLCLWPPPWAVALLRFPPLVWFGRISYGLYLWHWPVLVLVSAKRGIQSTPITLGAAALAIGLSALSFYFIERPALRLKRRFEADYARTSLKPGEATPSAL